MAKLLKLFSWNINGLRAALNKGTLHKFVDVHSPDILCLQEIKAHEDEAETELPQYIEYWHSAAKKGYSGTAIFSRFEAIQVLRDLPHHIAEKFGIEADRFGNANHEGRVIAAEYPEFWLVNVYTPNSKPDLSRLQFRFEKWDPAFLAYCKELERSKPVVICGDLNVAPTEEDLANPSRNRGSHGFTDQERASFQKLLEAGFVDTFRIFTQGAGHYSWWSNFANARARNVGWRIDFFLVSPSLREKVLSSQIHADVMGSDHCPVSLVLIL